MIYKCKALLADDIGLITEADIVIGFEKLSPSEQATSKTRKIWLHPALNILRLANLKLGISYVVSFDGRKYRYYHTDDIWMNEPVKSTAECSYFYFVGTLEAGLIWTAGDVEVWRVHKRRCKREFVLLKV